MWSDVGQSCAMMGLQATSGKRKLESGLGCMDIETESGESPTKLGRIEGSWWALDDTYSTSLEGGGQTQLTSYFDLESPSASLQPQSANLIPSPPTQQNQQQQQQQQHQSQTTNYYSATRSYRSPVLTQWGSSHYDPPTIRREENGKSYLELGSSYRGGNINNSHNSGINNFSERCCEGSRVGWCRRGRACHRQRRLAVLNISMCKLARYRQFPDPSLHRSVLICNTLRYLEREIERDRSPPPVEPIQLPQQPIMSQLQPAEHGRLTPFPMVSMNNNCGSETDTDSGIGDTDDSRSINWGSVLSLSSQSPLDPLNNNDLLDVDIGTELDIDLASSWKSSNELTSINQQQQQPTQQQLHHQHHNPHLQHQLHQFHQQQQQQLQHHLLQQQVQHHHHHLQQQQSHLLQQQQQQQTHLESLVCS